MTISLAFLAPDFVNAAIDGRLPHGMGVTRLTDLPAEWSRQHQMLDLGLCEPGSPLPGVLSSSTRSSTRKNLGGPRCWICGCPFALAVARKNARLCLDECRKIRGKFVRRHRALPQRMR